MKRSTQMFVSCILVMFGFVLFGCGGAEGDTYNTYVEPDISCIPGHSTFCACPGDTQGYQVCNDFGTYDTCRCPKPETDAGTPEASPTEDAETEPDAEADAEPDTGSETGTDAEADAEADTGSEIGSDAETDAEAESDAAGYYDLEIVFQGPMASTYVPGQTERPFYNALFCANRKLTVQNASYTMYARVGILINQGQPVFKNIKVKDMGAGITGMGPQELDVNGSVSEQTFVYNETYEYEPGNCRLMNLVVDVADIGCPLCTFQVGMNSMDAFDEDGNPIPNERINITQPMGNLILLGTAPSEDCPPYTPQSSLSITESALGHPEPAIVIGGKDVWVPMARYQACVEGTEDVKVSKINVQWRTQNNGSAESFELVGVAHQGNILGTAEFNNNDPYGIVDVDLGNGITVAKGDCQPIELWAKFAPVESSLQAGGEWSHHARSGNDVALRIGESVPQYGYDAYCNVADYAGKLFVHARGLTTGEKIFADVGATMPNFMTVRKSKPIVIPQQLTNPVLSAGEQELARFQVGADSNGAVAIKQVTLMVTKSSNVSLSSFRFYRGSLQLPANEYWITDTVSGADLSAGTISDSATIAVSFVGEEIINDNGKVYSLRATVGYIGFGNNVSVRFKADFPAKATPYTGYLLNNDSYTPYAASPHLFNVGDYSGCNNGGKCSHSLGTFVWSDNSEIPHLPQTQSAGGSRDWSIDQHVQDLSGSWLLSN